MNQKVSLEQLLDLTFSKGNRGEDPQAKAPQTPEEYILQKGDGFAFASMRIGRVPGLGLDAEQTMKNVPLWLGEAPEIPEISYEEDCELLVVGAGQSGSTAVLRAAELGVNVLCLESQTWEEYDDYACDMATYNSRYFLDRGVPEYDPMDIFNEYMRKSLGHAHPKLVRDYVTRSGEMLDWLLEHIPDEYIERYARIHNQNGNLHYDGSSCGSQSFIGSLQWRDMETNINMWPFVMRSVHDAARERGARFIYGAQAIRLIQNEDGAVIGCLARDIENRFFRVNSKVVLLAAGDFGGNPDMLLDLSDRMRNIAWSFGNDRSSTDSIVCGGRDGSGIRMALWAGATMEVGPRAPMGANMNSRPEFPFGGVWPCFGPDGRRFTNETIIHHGEDGTADMLPLGGIMAIVTDANWDRDCEYQGYGHEVMDRSNPHMLETVRREMANYKTGKDGFPVQMFARYGKEYVRVYAADTLEELGEILGYEGDSLKGFLDEVANWNAMCHAGKDTDWGIDPKCLFPIEKAPFFGMSRDMKNGKVFGGLCQHAGICTDGNYRVLGKDKHPLGGLYAVGNNCGQRYGVQYSTPTGGNCCGASLTNGYVAAEYIREEIEQA